MNDVNFLPESYIRQQQRRRRGLRQAVLLAVALVCVGGWWLAQHGQTQALRNEVELVEAQAAEAAQQMSELQRLRREHASLVKQVALREELAQPVSHTQVLAVLAKVLPASVSLTEVRMTAQRPAPKPQPTGKDKAGKAEGGPKPAKARGGPDELRIDLVGVAPDDRTVADVLAALNDCELLDDVMLRHSRATIAESGAAVRQFRVTLRVDLGVEYKPRSQAGGVAHAG